MSPRSRARAALPVAALMLLAFVLRLVYVLGLRESPYFHEPILDPLYHVQWARALAAGESFEEGPFFRAPLYVWMLAGVFRLFGDGLLAPRIVQCGLGAATTGLTYLVGERAFDRRVGLLASAGAATYWVLIYFDGELLIPTLLVPLTLLATWLTLGLADDPRPRRAALAGAAWGLAALARPNVLLFLPFLAGWFAWTARPRWRAAARPVVALAAGTLVPILPITAYNTFVGGDFALVSTQAGVNLWIGNNPWADGHTPRVPGTVRDDFQGTYRDAVLLAEAEAGRELRPSEVSRHYARKAREFLAGEPRRALGLLARKLALFWRDDEIGNNQPVRFFAHHFSPVARLSPLGFALLAPLGLAGLALGLRRRAFPVWGFVVVYSAGVVAFFVCSRFRVPVLSPLMVLGAHAVVWGADRWREGRRRATALLVAAVAAGVAVSVLARPDREEARVAGLLHLAVGYQLRGDTERAAALMDEAHALRPRDRDVLVQSAVLLEERGDVDGAVRRLESALAAVPADAVALDRLFGLLLRHGRIDELERRARAAAEALPGLATAHYHLAAVHLKRGRPQRAFAALESARSADPGGSRAQAALGQLHHRAGRSREAVELLEEAVDHDRFGDARTQAEETWSLLVDLLVELGERERALVRARQFLDRFPEAPRARRALDAARGDL